MNNGVTQNYSGNISDSSPRITAKDLKILTGYIAAAPLSWITPEWAWRMFSFPIAFLHACLHPHRTRSQTKKIRHVYGTGLKTLRPSLIEIQVLTGSVEQYFQYLREHLPGGWRPHIRLHGRTHIEKALKDKKGAILWVAPFLYSNLVVKKGLHQAGFAISHLSDYFHGPSNTRFGLRFINPILIEAEKRYLDERIIIPLGDKFGYIRRLERRLRENGLISINCDSIRDHKTVEQPVLNGRIQLPTGPPSLALATGAALLPVFTVRRAPGDFEIIIEPPFDLPDSETRHEGVELLINKYVRLVELFMVRYPALFSLWRNLRKNQQS